MLSIVRLFWHLDATAFEECLQRLITPRAAHSYCHCLADHHIISKRVQLYSTDTLEPRDVIARHR